MKACQRIGLIGAVISGGILTANADWITQQLPWANYGHVYNTLSGMAGGISEGYCAPTATANSFYFLETYYPSVYVNFPLSTPPNGVIAMRDWLVNGWVSPLGMQRPGMYSAALGGSTEQSWWENKVWYIEDYAPNTTVFGGMIESDPTLWYRGSDLTRGSPTWGFLWNEVSDAEDIEIAIDVPDIDLGHALTLTSMKFDDANGNQQWDPGEAREIDYLDPNNPTQLFWGVVKDDLNNGRLEFYWDNGGANAAQWVTIEGAFTESPIPEPGVLSLLVLGLVALLRRRLFA